MSLAIAVPENYGYVVLTTLVGHFAVTSFLGRSVMLARKEFNIGYPNLYAVPGKHAKADDFNRIQRGHQNYLEMAPLHMAMALIGGLQYPLVTSVFNVIYLVGSHLFQCGYADSKLDVKTARYAKGGGLKWLGLTGVLGTSISFAGSLQGWW